MSHIPVVQNCKINNVEWFALNKIMLEYIMLFTKECCHVIIFYVPTFTLHLKILFKKILAATRGYHLVILKHETENFSRNGLSKYWNGVISHQLVQILECSRVASKEDKVIQTTFDKIYHHQILNFQRTNVSEHKTIHNFVKYMRCNATIDTTIYYMLMQYPIFPANNEQGLDWIT
jgi:hypothetical protein